MHWMLLSESVWEWFEASDMNINEGFKQSRGEWERGYIRKSRFYRVFKSIFTIAYYNYIRIKMHCIGSKTTK